MGRAPMTCRAASPAPMTKPMGAMNSRRREEAYRNLDRSHRCRHEARRVAAHPSATGSTREPKVRGGPSREVYARRNLTAATLIRPPRRRKVPEREPLASRRVGVTPCPRARPFGSTTRSRPRSPRGRGAPSRARERTRLRPRSAESSRLGVAAQPPPKRRLRLP